MNNSDVLNLIALFSQDQYKQFEVMDPQNQTISFNDGKFNRVFALDKDPRVSVYLLNNPSGNDVEYEFID